MPQPDQTRLGIRAVTLKLSGYQLPVAAMVGSQQAVLRGTGQPLCPAGVAIEWASGQDGNQQLQFFIAALAQQIQIRVVTVDSHCSFSISVVERAQLKGGNCMDMSSEVVDFCAKKTLSDRLRLWEK